jgi:hypothetical protein
MANNNNPSNGGNGVPNGNARAKLKNAANQFVTAVNSAKRAGMNNKLIKNAIQTSNLKNHTSKFGLLNGHPAKSILNNAFRGNVPQQE